jgi:hypothetical protein
MAFSRHRVMQHPAGADQIAPDDAVAQKMPRLMHQAMPGACSGRRQ